MDNKTYMIIKNANEMTIKKDFANIMDILIDSKLNEKEKIENIKTICAAYTGIHK
ncbi:hypothetical protein [Mammaliicoccus sciuri]|uniref:hypothetical protein n=1 Tax=Mammaliicoccus sciuri TaxID=1296 RepID=UPI003F54D33C